MRSTALCHACHPLVEGQDAQARAPSTPLPLLQAGRRVEGRREACGLEWASFPRSAGRPCGDFPVPSLWLPPPGAGGVSVSSREARFPWAALTTATLPFLGSTSCALTEAWPLSEGAASGT